MHSLQFSGLRWTRFCFASTATALFTSAAALSASASQKHALLPGESLDAVARRYHVSVPDLARVNGIEDQDNIPDGKMLTIPDPPRHLRAEASLHLRARVSKDSVSVRLGPGLEYRRAAFAHQDDAVVVTAQQDSWAQITTETGETGWVLQSLLHTAHHEAASQVASNRRENPDAPAHSRKPKHHADMVALEEDRSRARRVARRQGNALNGAHRRHAQQQEPGNGEQPTAHSSQIAGHTEHSGAKKHHETQVARIEHHAASTRRYHHIQDSEPAVSSHTRNARRHHSEEAAVAETRTARLSRHHTGAEQAANAPRHTRRHADQVAQVRTRHVAREIGHRRNHDNDASGTRVVAAVRHHHAASGEADAPEAGNDIVRTAYGYRGTPYVWGGERPGGFDCSGFTMHLYGRKGISLPHSARAQFGMGSHVDKSGMKPGDLVFFHTVTPGISHVGMYVGSGKFVHASSRRSGGVRVDNIDSGYYSQAFRGARRMRKGE